MKTTNISSRRSPDTARHPRRPVSSRRSLTMPLLSWLGLTLLLSIAHACTDPDDALNTTSGTAADAIRFEISIAPAEGAATRATTDALFRTTFEDGDAIGIFGIDQAHLDFANPDLHHPIHNAKLTYDGATGTWQGDVYWPDGFTGRLHFFAYYPYDDCGGHPETMNPGTFTFRVATDQNATATAATAGRDPYSLSDLMGAYDGSYDKNDLTTGSVSLLFHHLMAMVQVSVPAGMKGSGPDETLAVKLNNVQTEAKVNLGYLINSDLVARANPQADPTTLIMRRVEQPGDADYATTYTYRALLPAQSVLSPTGLIRLDYGPWMFTDAPMTERLELWGGQVETFVRALPAEAKIISTAFIPAGTFLMGSSDGSNIGDKDGSGLNTTPAEEGRGSNEPQHRVTLTRGFYMSRYLVTNAQYAAFLNDIKCGERGKFTAADYAAGQHPGKELVYNHAVIMDTWGMVWDGANNRWKPIKGYEDHPAIYVSWYGADEYARWMGGALPTEAQWEYACRAGTTTTWSFGDDISLRDDYGWHIDNSGGTTHPVGTKKPNAWGLYDMYGNVFEWCADWYDDNYGSTPGTPATDPTGPDKGTERVWRSSYYGGGFSSAYRTSYFDEFGEDNLGFRVVIPQP